MAEFRMKYASEGVGHPLHGIGGWLAWFMIVVVVQVIVTLVRFPASIRNHLDLVSTVRVFPIVALVTPLEIFFHLFIVIVGGYLLVVTWKKDPRVPQYWGVYLVACAGYGILDIASCRLFLHSLAAHLSSTDVSEVRTELAAAEIANLRLVIWTAIWLLYWHNSERVRVTFGSNTWRRGPGADSVAAPPSEDHSESPASVF